MSFSPKKKKSKICHLVNILSFVDPSFNTSEIFLGCELKEKNVTFEAAYFNISIYLWTEKSKMDVRRRI